MPEKALEVRRQLFHLVLGSLIAIAVWILKPVYGNLILIPLAIAIVLLYAIPKIKPDLKVSNHLLTRFERKKDVESFPYKGAIHYGIGIFFPIWLLEVNLACVIILILSVGDAMSTLVGKFYGRHRIGEKSIEGTLAFTVSGFIACLLFLKIAGRMDLARTALELTLLGAFIEMVSKIDDNLAVPMTLAIMAKLAKL